MLIRLFKAISVPVFFTVGFIPVIVISSIMWIITGRYSPMKVMDSYVKWIQD